MTPPSPFRLWVLLVFGATLYTGPFLAGQDRPVLSARKPESRDSVPYESHPYVQTHPSRLFVVGTLFGTRPTPVQRCRVLELGCAAGGNLIPMADALPESEFIGIDASERAIED